MNRFRIVTALAVSAIVVSGLPAHADIKTKERSLVKFEGLIGGMMGLFGGKAAKEGVVNTVALKGDRKLTANDSTGEIVDLQEEKVYRLDMKNRTYEVVTFTEMRRQMEAAQKQAAEAAARMGGQERPARAQQPQQAPQQQPQLEVDFSVKETGQKKVVNGFDARQAVMTIAVREKGKTLEQGGGLVLTSDMWLAPSVPGGREVADFDMRYARKLMGPAMMASAQHMASAAQQMASAMAMYPGLGQAISKMKDETVKLDGTAIVTTTTIEAVKSPEQMAQGESEQQQAPGGLGGLLARKLAKRGGDEGKPGGPKNRATIMTFSNELISASADVAPTDVALPAGFRQK